jgi:Mce-associated membrane protein
MRSRKQTPPEVNGDHVDDAAKSRASEETHSADDALALAEEAEAEAAEAEAVAAAARARTRAIRMRREAEAAKSTAPAETPEPTETVAAPETAEETDEDTDEEKVETDTAVDESDEADAVADAGEEPEAEPAKKRRRVHIPLPSWKAVAAAVTVLVIAALLAGCGYMYWYHRQAEAQQQRRAEFAAAARQGVVTLMSLDYTKAKEDVQRIIDNSTGQFKADFQNTADDFVQVAVESKAITETNVTGTAVESMTDDTATVLVAASSRVTNAAGAKQEPRAWRLSVNLARDGGQLKLAKVEFVP